MGSFGVFVPASRLGGCPGRSKGVPNSPHQRQHDVRIRHDDATLKGPFSFPYFLSAVIAFFCPTGVRNPGIKISGSGEMAKSVLVVDDTEIIRRAIRRSFNADPDFEICGEAENGHEAIEKAAVLCPDLIVLDLSMPVMNGLDAARILARRLPGSMIIMFSEYCGAISQEEGRLAGISALVSKSENISVLVSRARALLFSTAA